MHLVCYTIVIEAFPAYRDFSGPVRQTDLYRSFDVSGTPCAAVQSGSDNYIAASALCQKFLLYRDSQSVSRINSFQRFLSVLSDTFHLLKGWKTK